MPVFLERFLLTVCAAAFFGLVIGNSMNLDGRQRTSLGVVIVAAAYFVGHTVHKLNNPAKPIPSSHLFYPTPPASSESVPPDSQTSSTKPPATGDASPKPSNGPKFKAEAKSKLMQDDAKSVDRSVKIGTGSQLTNSPIVTGDGNIVSIGDTPRSLSHEQIKNLAHELEPFAGQPIHLVAGFFDGESQRYAEHFHQAFKGAHWEIVQFVFQDKLPKGTELGLWMGINDKDNQPPAAVVLGKYLIGTLNLQVQGIEFSDAKDGHVYLIVGLRP